MTWFMLLFLWELNARTQTWSKRMLYTNNNKLRNIPRLWILDELVHSNFDEVHISGVIITKLRSRSRWYDMNIVRSSLLAESSKIVTPRCYSYGTTNAVEIGAIKMICEIACSPITILPRISSSLALDLLI